MYLVEVFFKQLPSYQGDMNAAYQAINKLIDEWRYNGQIIGREISLYVAKQEDTEGFGMRAVCPEQHSLLPEWNNQFVDKALEKVENLGLWLDNLQIIAEDLNAEITCTETPSWQMLYTSFVQSCSPLHSGDTLAPIPLYKQLKGVPHLAKDIIKWQENWQAYDQLQMNAAALEKLALAEISNVDTRLFKHGYALRQQIEEVSGIPTYYYLYRVGGEDLVTEENRHCPLCQKPWKLQQNLFGVFDFKCDHCRLLSNIAWDVQS